MSFTFTSLALLAIVLPPCALSQAGLLGQKSQDGKIRFQAVEELQIEGSRRVRLAPIALERITPDDAKRFPRVDLALAGTLRTNANHRLVRVDDAGKPSDLVLADEFVPTTPVDAAFAQGRLAIQVFQSKKARTFDLIAPEQFFVFVPGAEPDRLALALINRSSAFVSLDEQLAAMEGFAASFPDSPLKSEFRSQLQGRIAAALTAFDNRGPYSDLSLTRRYADLAQRAFPADPALGQLEAAISKRISIVESTPPKLRSLAASGEWDLLLDAYLPFEPYQWSFPDTMDLRQTALEESARLHARRGTLLAERHWNVDALHELTLAASRDPDNFETAKLLETARMAIQPAGVRPRVLAAGSQEELRFKRGLLDAERAIQANDLVKADASIQQAQAENKDAPELLILQARLLAARGRDAEALPFLDAYHRAVADPAARESGDAARTEILSDLEKKRTDFKRQLRALERDGEYSKIRSVAAKALALDPDDDDFLYYSGTVAALFRDPAAATELDRYLARSNSLRADPQARGRAYRIRSLPAVVAPPQLAGTPNWFSGRRLADGVFYCPLSGAFQVPIDNIQGYKLKMIFQWDGDRLTAIVTSFDDDKGAQYYHSLGGPSESQGNFHFAYAGSEAQVQAVSTHMFDDPAASSTLRVSHEPPNPPHLVDDRGLPQILLRDSPRFNPAVLSILEGPLNTTVAGNSFFNPFIWDGLHYFTPTYDEQGRMSSAREWNADSLVRFNWSGDRLTEVRAFRKDASTPYYERSIGYSGNMIVGETYTEGSKTGQIKYMYSGKVLQQVKVEDGGVHDGKTWTIRMR